MAPSQMLRLTFLNFEFHRIKYLYEVIIPLPKICLSTGIVGLAGIHAWIKIEGKALNLYSYLKIASTTSRYELSVCFL